MHDNADASSWWKFTKAEDPNKATGTVSSPLYFSSVFTHTVPTSPQETHPDPLTVTCPTLHTLNVKHRVAITIPPQWITTISAVVFLTPAPVVESDAYFLFWKVSFGQCLNLVRIQRKVQGVLELADLISPWESINQAMVVTGGEANSYAIQAVDEPTVVLLDFFHSRNTRRRDPLGLPGKGDTSDNLRVSTVCRFSSCCS